MDVRIEECPCCDGCGEVEEEPIATPEGPHTWTHGCGACCGTGAWETVVEPLEEDDLDLIWPFDPAWPYPAGDRV